MPRVINAQLYDDPSGYWFVDANGHLGTLLLWHSGGTWGGQFSLRGESIEALSSVVFDRGTGELQFSRPASRQQFQGKLDFDVLKGKFTYEGQSYNWHAQWYLPALARIESTEPRVEMLSYRPGPPAAARVLVLIEERLVGGLLATLSNGVSSLSRWLDDLQNEGFEVCAYTYDVRSHEDGTPGHRHLPSEFMALYRYVCGFYHACDCMLSGVVLVGDFPAAGSRHFSEYSGPGTQAEMDYFGVDAILADPWGYWPGLGTGALVRPGSLEVYREGYDEGLPPNGRLYPRSEWSAPGFWHTRQWEAHHLQRDPEKFGSEPQFWVGRITAAQVAFQTGPNGLTFSEDEEITLLAKYFARNHEHRTHTRERRGYIFLEQLQKGVEPDWRGEQTKMATVIPPGNIVVHCDSPAFAAGRKASIANYLESFKEEYLICHCVMHSDYLNHYFSAESGQDQFPPTFPKSFSSVGSPFSVPLGRGSVQSTHLRAIPNISAAPRFYLLGGCDVGAILHRPQFLVEGQHISPGTPLRRQYGANLLGIAYLMYAQGLAVLAHNVTNPPGDYSPLYQTLHNDATIGDAILALMKSERASNLPHYRNILFGDPTLRLSY